MNVMNAYHPGPVVRGFSMFEVAGFPGRFPFFIFIACVLTAELINVSALWIFWSGEQAKRKRRDGK